MHHVAQIQEHDLAALLREIPRTAIEAARLTFGAGDFGCAIVGRESM
jgi:hypothetical protein